MKKGFFILFAIGIVVFLAIISGINLVIKSYEKEITAPAPAASPADEEEPINTLLDQERPRPILRPQPQTKAPGGGPGGPQEAPPAQKAPAQKESPLPRGVPLVN